ncbi:MAG: putative competence-damage inducible protein [Melioribacteraceae bacterium]|nr:MAG: putative competence-damage inducible protein [Melioribacteraceae bacterium]
MKAYLISIGDELLIGQTTNTNAAFIGSKLTEIQLKIGRTSVIADDVDEVKKEFQIAYNTSDLIIVTGGLGPTHDDITLKAVVDFFDAELVLNEEVLADVEALFKKRGREITELNRKQAYIPKNAEPIRNSRGTAPGLYIEKDGKTFVVMPGVPYEMQGMMEKFVIPRLVEKMGGLSEFKYTKNLLTTGIPESFLYERLGNLDDLLGSAKLAFLPNQFGVKMRLTVSGDTEDDARTNLEEIEQKIRSFVGRFIYGSNGDSLEDVVSRLLIDRGLTVAVAESCTGGLISSRLTNIAGSSNFFERGMITYSNGAKVENLKVSEDLLVEKGAVSLEVARQMAEGIRAVSMTDIGLAVTGIMGPDGGTDDKPVGLVYIGICDDKICTAKEFRFGDDRLLNKDRTSQAALDMLRRHLLGISYDE